MKKCVWRLKPAVPSETRWWMIGGSAHQRPRSSSACKSWYVGNDRVKTFPRKLSNLSLSALEHVHKKNKNKKKNGHVQHGTCPFVKCSAAQHFIWSTEGQRSLVLGSLLCVNKTGRFTVRKLGSSTSDVKESFFMTMSRIPVNCPNCHYFLVVTWHWLIGTLLPGEEKLELIALFSFPENLFSPKSFEHLLRFQNNMGNTTQRLFFLCQLDSLISEQPPPWPTVWPEAEDHTEVMGLEIQRERWILASLLLSC